MVFAIIGILLALLLPAIQAAREAARRAQWAYERYTILPMVNPNALYCTISCTRLAKMFIRRWMWLVVLPCVVALSGCGNREMFHVSGKVTYKDGSVPKGILAVVIFTPTGNSSAAIRKSASGAIEPDGSFDMVTRMSGDGVHRGEYAVTFRILRDPLTQASLVSPKYTSPVNSAFTVTVDHDISDLNYQIEKTEGVSPATTAEAPTGPGTTSPGT